MIFQTFDDKKKCIAVFANGRIYKDKLPESLTKTWDYSEALRDSNVEYAKYYCEGKTLDEVCPDHLRKEWEDVCRTLSAFQNAVYEATLYYNAFILESEDGTDAVDDIGFKDIYRNALNCKTKAQYCRGKGWIDRAKEYEFDYLKLILPKLKKLVTRHTAQVQYNDW